jgi:hypothetical protein
VTKKIGTAALGQVQPADYQNVKGVHLIQKSQFSAAHDQEPCDSPVTVWKAGNALQK